MHDRLGQLLCGLVEEYIATGKPVSSRWLADAQQLTISPATVRHSFQELDEQGYLFQPHTSAGRVPTDRGFRYYVDHAVTPQLPPQERERLDQLFEDCLAAYGVWTRSVAHLLAEVSHTMAITVAWQPIDVQEAGVHELLAQIDQRQLAIVREMAHLVDMLDREASQMNALVPEQRVVFIGAENPLLDAQHTSLLIRRAAQPGGAEVLLILAGAKRMAYEKNMALLDYVATLA